MIRTHLPAVRSAVLLAVFLGILNIGGLKAQFVDSTFWVPNGPVEALVLHDTTVIIGGNFDQVAPYTGSFVRLDTSSALPDPSLFKVNGPVHAMFRDTGGYIYVGGSFSRCGNEPVENIFRMTPAGTFDYSFNHHVNGTVYSLIVHDTCLYIGGDFSAIDGEARNNIGSIVLHDGTVAVFDPNVNGPVYCMYPDDLYGYMMIGGNFNQVGSFTPPYLAKVKFTTGAPMTFNAVPWTATPNCNGPVYAMAIDGPEVYIGGEFTTFGSFSRKGLAALNIYSGALKYENANVQGYVYSMFKSGRKLYFGGTFTSVAAQPRSNLACVDTGFILQAWNPMVNGRVNVIAPVDSARVFAGGDFSLANNQTAIRGALINYQDTGTVAAWNPQFNFPVYTAYIDELHRLYAGGDFFAMHGEMRNNLCALSVSSGRVTAWNPDVNATVRTLALDHDSLYFAGDFTLVSGNPRGRLAAIDLQSATLLPFNPGVNGMVRTMAFTDSAIYLGGNFSLLGGEARSNIGKIDKYTTLTSNWDPGCAGTVNSLLVNSGWVYVAGYYSTIAGVPRQNLARLSPSTGNADWNWICDTDDGIYKAEFYNNQLAIAGWFNTVNSVASADFAWVDTATLQVTAPLFNGDGYVRTFATYGDDFFMAGTFTLVNALYRPHLVAYDAGNSAVDSWTPAPNGMPVTLAATSNRIFIGGTMTYTAGRYHPYLQVLNTQWVTAVQENPSSEMSVNVFPVPATDLITVITNTMFTGYTITDLAGKTVQSGSMQMSNGEGAIDISALAAGGYILSLHKTDGTSASRRIIRY